MEQKTRVICPRIPSQSTGTKGRNCHLSAQEELEPLEELGLCLHGLGLLPGSLHGLAVIRHGDVVKLSHLQTGAPLYSPVLWIRLRIREFFLDLPDPDPLVRGTDNPSYVKQK
jgi:hypothetical protein